jgi:hypothetical protein
VVTRLCARNRTEFEDLKIGMSFACLPSELVARVPAQRRDWSESYHWQGEKSLQMHGGIKARETS